MQPGLSCPNCRHVDSRFVPLAKIERNLYNDTKVTGCTATGCSMAKTKMSIEQLNKHLSKECLMMLIKCPQKGCSSVF